MNRCSLTRGTTHAALYPRLQFLRLTVNGRLISRAGAVALGYFGLPGGGLPTGLIERLSGESHAQDRHRQSSHG